MSEFLGGVLRFVLEVILEFVIRGPGYLLCKPFRKDVNPEGGLVFVVGLVFWAALAVGGWYIYRAVSETAAI